ncbi:ion transporter [Candidatus Palauibacter polyketidifaciens]|uniref:ion transporter n=1 Tax=Candidatus Palauibacter polyketidifaciens TaxID=3056740 RepID=UPI0023A74CD7|nr:ion transporter [Candidatus Palauibacter polyketidifaciens]MDE2721379.1 ion transporter [Candidatus Palauibacter polyketidifaciens]
MAKNRTMSYFPSRRDPPRPAIDYEAHPVFSQRPRWRCEAHRIIFGNLTPAGRLFDVVLIGVILASVVVVMLESVQNFDVRARGLLWTLEWVFTALFTVEYVLRLISAERASGYARSFFGIVDLLAVLPNFVGLLIPGGQALAVIRVLRVLRVFRVLKLAQFVGGERLLINALRSSSYKIAVFIVAVLVVVTLVGAAMYVIEGADAGFDSIPRGVYWAIVTVTTVGFGDITPQTTVGQMLAALLMILGYGVIAVPTGIVTAELAGREFKVRSARATMDRLCLRCASPGHDEDASHCKHCGSELLE